MAEPFKSELDWSPESWFSRRIAKSDGTRYTNEDVKSLNSHLQEYLDIERDSKANGTWLNMPDGSKWTGDPRSWIMMQSKAFKENYSSQPWWSGQFGEDVTKAPYDNGSMWFSNNVGMGDYYAHVIDSSMLENRFDSDNFGENPEKYVEGYNFLSAIPKKGNYRQIPIDKNAPKRGNFWTKLPYKLENNDIIYDTKSKVKTDDVVDWSKQLGDEGVFINNVWDGRTRSYYLSDDQLQNAIQKSRKRNRVSGFQFDQGDNKSVNEFISQPGFTNKVKFIEGNNGDFDINNPYKYAYNPQQKDNILRAFYGTKLNKKDWYAIQ